MPDKNTIPLADALRIVDEVASEIKLHAETVPVRGALGRHTIVPQRSKLDLPPFDKSAMDGYAVMAGDERDSYRLIETVAAGSVPARKLEPGTAIKVMTGAPVPEGAGKVIMVENTSSDGKTVNISKHDKYANICLRGEDVKAGDVILEPTILGPLEIANLIACGITEVEAAAPPRVAILSTGEEIVDSAEALTPGKIMNSNGPMLAALCKSYAIDVTEERIVPDNLEATTAAIKEALQKSDIVLLSGGVSAGDFDFVCPALEACGLRVHFNSVAMKPGKPATFAAGRGKLAFGLPGNPVSVYVTFHLFVIRAINLMSGTAPRERLVSLPLSQDFSRRGAGRTAFIPCLLTESGEVMPVAYHGSAHLKALLQSDGFFVVPEGNSQVRAGERVAVLFTGLLK